MPELNKLADKAIKSFFSSRYQRCPVQNCSLPLERTVEIFISVHLGKKNWASSIYFFFEEDKCILQEFSNKSPSGNSILDSDLKIKNISDLKSVCSDLVTFGYKLDQINFLTKCSIENNEYEFEGSSYLKAHFFHDIFSNWIETDKKCLLMINRITINHITAVNYYDTSEAELVIQPTTKMAVNHSYKHLLPIDMNQYSTIEHQLNKILLLTF